MSVGKEFDAELDAILRKRDGIAKAEAIEMHSDVVQATPVDTGHLKGSWEWVTGRYKYITQTNVEYAPTIDGGRRMVDGKWQGSEQLPHGWQPIIKRHRENIKKLLRRIK
jgi:hypothetical protein